MVDKRLLIICGVSLADRPSSREILERYKLVDVEVVLKKKRLFCFGLVKSCRENDPLTRIQEMDVPGRCPKGKRKRLGTTVFAKILQILEFRRIKPPTIMNGELS